MITMDLKEWHEYDNETRRSRVAFQMRHEHFSFVHHEDILRITMIDKTSGIVEMKSRHRRSFFIYKMFPGIKTLFIVRGEPQSTAVPQAWCTGLAEKMKGWLDTFEQNNINKRRLQS